MTSMLITGADGIFTGLPGDAMRATGAIRIRDGRITEMGNLDRQPDERVIDATGCVVYPGLISTHHHLFQSILKGVSSGINLPLMGWLRSVPHAYWSEIGEEELYVAARIGLVELLLSGTTTAADHHYMFSDTYRFDPADETHTDQLATALKQQFVTQWKPVATAHALHAYSAGEI